MFENPAFPVTVQQPSQLPQNENPAFDDAGVGVVCHGQLLAVAVEQNREMVRFPCSCRGQDGRAPLSFFRGRMFCGICLRGGAAGGSFPRHTFRGAPGRRPRRDG